MARATRSSAAAANLEPRASSKKRKRVSNADNDEQPSSKLPKVHSHDPLPSAALSHLHDADAAGILDILEVTDSQGLLDRVFPLPPEAPSQGSFSLRTLLKQASQHPLWVLRAAVQNLFPLSSSHPRSRPSETAIQQHRFCKVALSFLDQASRNAVPVPLTVTSLLDSDSAATSDSPPADDGRPDTARDAVYSYKRHALVQRLPSGDYWTSLNADIHSSTKQLKDLSLGNAELVAVFPTPSKSDSATSVPLFGSYHTQKVAASTSQQAGPRRVSSGTFLDYGLSSSFAPTFDHGYQVVGRSELGELLYHREKRKEIRKQENMQIASLVEVEDEIRTGYQHTDTDKLDELLPSDLEQSLKDALKCLELENAVNELLEKNRRALHRLQELQRMRLSTPDGGSSHVVEDSEEWEIAHAILDSLTVLASLRPSSTETKLESIVPPATVLRRLHRTLIRQPTEGWYGTLPPARTTALRDDATVKVRAGSVASTTPTTTTPAAATNPVPTTPYAGYTYAYGQQAYRPPAATASYAYKQGQYYPTPYLATTGQQLGTQSYYGQQTYAGGATGQQPYAAYSAWYSQYSAPAANPPAAAASGNTSSGRGTPQPAASTTGATPSTYGSFFPAAGTPPPGVARSPAVANTVLGNKTGTPGTTWTSYNTGQQQAGYYGAYGSTAR